MFPDVHVGRVCGGGMGVCAIRGIGVDLTRDPVLPHTGASVPPEVVQDRGSLVLPAAGVGSGAIPGMKRGGGSAAHPARGANGAGFPPALVLPGAGPGGPEREGDAGAVVINPAAPVVICAWCEAEWEREGKGRRGGPGQTGTGPTGARVSHGVCKRHLGVLRGELAGMDWRFRDGVARKSAKAEEVGK